MELLGHSRMRNLHGPAKAAAQAGIILTMAGRIWRDRRRLGLEARDVPRYMKDLLTLSSGPTDLKYVRFGRKLFVDGYTPPWPSEGFFRSVTATPSFAAADPERPIPCVYAVVSITSRCMYRCAHCYTSYSLEQKDRLPLETILGFIDRMLDLGLGVLSLEGGEPLLRFDDLLVILERASGRTNPYIATTGYSLTREKAELLAQKGLVAAQVSLDHYDKEFHNNFRRSPKAFDAAVESIALFAEAGVFPIISMVATADLVRSGGLYRFLDFAKEIGAGMIQVLEPLPAGSNTPDQDDAQTLTEEEMRAVYDFHVEANTDKKWRDHPAVSARLYVESERSLGCAWGGLGIYYIDSNGNMKPCPFINLSAGNVVDEGFDAVYRRMRALFPRPVGGLCPAYEVGPEESKALAEGMSLPLPPEKTKEIARKIAERPLPDLLGKIER